MINLEFEAHKELHAERHYIQREEDQDNYTLEMI